MSKQKTKTEHPYFSSWHYQQYRAITEKKLITLGYSPNERKDILYKCDHSLAHMLSTGEMVYLKVGRKELVFTKNE